MATFYADISEFQSVANGAYPYPVLAFRVDNGSRLDFHASANWAHCHATPQIQAAIGYVVFKPGQRANILRRVKALFGATAPSKLVLMIDMESGQEFAGGGNHSAEANGLAADFAAYLGSEQRVLGYANQYDFRSNWPSRPGWLKLVTANYGTSNPGTFGWQFYGGVPNPRPAGYPGSCPPFGSSVDLNAIQLPLGGVLAALGLEDVVTPADIKAIAVETVRELMTWDVADGPGVAEFYKVIVNTQAAVAALAVDVAAIKAKDNA